MIEVDRKHLSRGIALASLVVQRRNNIPVLGTIKAVANGSLALEATDLDIETRVEMPYTGKATDFLLPDPSRVRSAIDAAGGGKVEIGRGDSETKEQVTLRSGELSATLNTLAVDDFPALGRISCEDFACDFGAAELRQIARVATAMSTEETRYYLNGICVTKVDDWLYRFAATDGHRLMIVEVPLPGATGELPSGVIIPKRWVHLVLSNFRRTKEAVRLTYGRAGTSNQADGTLAVEKVGMPRISMAGQLGDIRLAFTSKLIDGTYPDYMRVVPAESAFALRVRRSDLIQAVLAVSAIGTDKLRAVKLRLKPDALVCELNSPDLGDGKFRIAAEHNHAPADFAIGFNGQYLLDMLRALTGDEVIFALTDAGAPALVTDPADTAFRGVLMPMRA